MAEPNYHKQAAIGTWILVVLTIGLGLLTYLRPPDPAHPMSLDFLSRSLVMPPWLALCLLVIAIEMTRRIVRSRTLTTLQNRKPDYGKGICRAYNGPSTRTNVELQKRDQQIAELRSALAESDSNRNSKAKRIAELEKECAQNEQLKKQISDLQTQNATLRSQLQSVKKEPIRQATLFYGGGLPSEKLPDFDPFSERVVLRWPEELEVRIRHHSFGAMKGLLCEVANLRPTWIGGLNLEIANATSWDQLHAQFRESRYFKALQVASAKELGPASSTVGHWFLRTEGTKIILGNSQEPVLTWPIEDPSTKQVWRLILTLSFDEHHEPATLLLSWDSSSDLLSMVQQNSSGAVLP
jgi:hypothetical protein